MDARVLLEVVGDVEREIRNSNAPRLKDLLAQYVVARDSAQTDNSQNISKAMEALAEAALASATIDYPASRLKVLHGVGGSQWVGSGFLEKVTAALTVAGQTAAGIVVRLTSLQAELEAFRKGCASTRSGMEGLGLTPIEMAEGTFSAGVIIPEGLVGGNLGGLAKELEAWNKIFRALQEVAGEEAREVQVERIASGSYELHIAIGFSAATLLSRTIDKVLEWYLKILEIRTKRMELKALGAPIAEPEAIKKHERDLLDKNIREFADQLVKDLKLRQQPDRANELKALLVTQVKRVVSFVDRGGLLEVDGTFPEDPEEPEELDVEADDLGPEERRALESKRKEHEQALKAVEQRKALLRAGQALKKLPPHTEPIFQLSEGDEPAGDSAPGTPKRKS